MQRITQKCGIFEVLQISQLSRQCVLQKVISERAEVSLHGENNTLVVFCKHWNTKWVKTPKNNPAVWCLQISEPIIFIIDGNGFLTPLKKGEESVIIKGNCFSSVLSRSTAQAIFSRWACRETMLRWKTLIYPTFSFLFCFFVPCPYLLQCFLTPWCYSCDCGLTVNHC